MNSPAPRDVPTTSHPDAPEAAARARLRGLGSRVTEPR
ncbi:transcriptional repressor, partial [Ralstonia pseudosolanacearum]